ncbi:MAG: tandem-95 repeat protein [Sphingomonadales bacterium]|nr:MAG: tandem-95 repeat protein [Sphingomonadales bacterium]
MATYNGTNGDDVINASAGNNTINAGNGNNRVTATSSGSQNVNAGTGNDTITTGDGNDTINAGDGVNVINAGNGTNNVTSGSGNDTINTGTGNDNINAGNGRNIINAGDGRNTVTTGTGDDEIRAGSGDDQIYAGEGTNWIDAGNGNNTVTAGAGSDTITTGSGNDNISAGNGNNVINAGAGNNTVNAGTGDDWIRTLGGNDQINAGDGRNDIDAGDGNNTVNTGRGDDTIVTGRGNDQINAGDGRNIIDAGEGDNRVNTGSGNDDITTGDDCDVINAGEGVNVIRAGDGDNDITSGAGADTITAGSGNDDIHAGEGHNVIDAGNGRNTVTAGAGNDQITTGSGNDAIYAGEGHNIVNAGNGNNAVYTGSGNDQITTGSGNDAIYAGEGNNIINAGDGVNLIYSGSGNDRITTGDGTDLVYTGNGDDIVDLGGGSDVVYLDGGNDTYIYNMTDNRGDIDIAWGGSGTDTLKLVLTADQARDARVLSDIQRFNTDSDGNGLWGWIFGFQFSAFNLSVRDFEVLDVIAPVDAINDAATVNEDSQVAINVLANDLDLGEANNSQLRVISYDATNVPGTLTLANNQFTFVPGAAYQYLALGQTATVSFTYTIGDNEGFTDTATVTLTITGSNDGPVAVADVAGVTENQTVTVDVLANDTDVDNGAVLTLVSAGTPAGKGSATVVNNKLVFNPGAAFDHLKAGATETVVVSYSMKDQHGATSTSTLTLTITGTNDGPVAVADTAAGTENQTLTINVLANDTDIDDNAVFTLTGAAAPAGKGTAAVVNNQLVFTPGAAFDHLAAGVTEVVVLNYAMKDEFGAVSNSTVTVTITGTNDGPVAVVDTAAGTENQTLTINVLANDTDVDDNAVFTLVSVSTPAGKGAATVVNNKVGFNPGAAFDHLAAGVTETVTLTYTMRDQHGATSTSTVTLTITGTNDGPVAIADVAAGTENQTLTVNVLANDTDLDDNAVFTLTSATAPSGKGVATVVGNSLVFNPGTDFDHLALGAAEVVTVSYTMRDDQGAESVSTLTVTITGTNDAPVAVADVAATTENASITVNVLANDTDLDDNAVFTLVSASAPLGAASVAGNQLVFNPGTDFDHLALGATQNVVVSYAMTDENGATSTSTVTITVTGTNDGPVAVADAAATTENASITVDVLANDTDLDDGAVFTLTAVAAPAGKGAATIVGNSLVFTPGTDFDHLAAGATEIVTVSYTMQDENGATASSTLTVTITGTNDAPVAVADVAATTENAAITVDVLANDTDLDDGAVFTLTAAAAPAGKGVATIAGNSLVFTPGADFDHLALGATEIVTVSYTMRDDQGAESVSTLTITITGTNDGPVAVADTAAGTENQSLTIDVLGNDTDVDDGAVFTLTGVGAPAGKGLAAVVNNKLVFAPGADFDHLALGVTEIVTLTYTMTDEHGATSASTVTVTITGTNDAPVAGFDTATTSENVSVAINVMANDTDVDDGAVLTVVGAAMTNPSEGSVAIVNNQLVYTPANFDHLAVGASASVTIFYAIVDQNGGQSAATVTVTVTGTNDGPIAVADIAATTENAAITVDVLANDTDVDDGAVFTLTAAAAPAGKGAASVVGNSLVFTPGTDFDHLALGATELVTVSYTMTDEHGATSTSTLTVTITGTNDAPVAVADVAATSENASITVDVLANDTDVDDAHVFTLVSASAPLGAASIVGNSLVFNPGADFDHLALGATETVIVSYLMTDENGATSSSTVTITVTGTNDAPVAVADTAAGTENQILTINVLTNDTDLDDGHVFTLTTAGAPSGKGLAAVVNNQLVFTPGADFDHLALGVTEVVTLTYTMRDENGATSSSTVTVTITGTNDAPVAGFDAAATTENASVTINVLANDTDLDDGAVLTVTGAALSNPSQGSVAVVNNQLVYTPAGFDHLALGVTASVLIFYSITDQNGGVSAAVVSVTVTGTNDAPVAVADLASITENQTITVNVLANDTDVDDNAVFTLTAAAAPAGKGVATVVNNQLVFTPGTSFDHLALDASEVVTVSYTMRDENGATSTSTLTVTITGTNDAPVAVADFRTGTEDNGVVSGTVAANDSDVDDGAVLGFALNAPVAGLTFNADGSYSFDTSNAAYQSLSGGQQLAVVANYTVTDQHGATAQAALTITLTGTNDAPLVTSTAAAATGNVTEAGNLDDGSVVAGTSVASGQLTSSDIDNGATATWTGSANGTYGSFAMGANGLWTYTLDNSRAATQGLREGQTVTETFQARVTDDRGAFAMQAVTVTVTGTNDAPVIQSGGSGVYNQPSDVHNHGQANAVSLNGLLSLSDNPSIYDSTTIPHVTVNGSADGQTDWYSFTVTTAGQVTIDVDYAAFDAWLNLYNAQGGLLAQSDDAGYDPGTSSGLDSLIQTYLQPGTYFIQMARFPNTTTSGGYTFHLSVEGASGSSDYQAIVTEAGNLDNGALVAGTATAGGTARSTDVDTNATASWTGSANGIYGSFAINAAGVWTYTLDNSRAATQALAEGQTVNETFPITVTDDFGAAANTNVVVAITGTNDRPIAVADTVTVLEGASVITGSVAANDSDVDAGAVLSYQLLNTVAGLSFSANGSYSFDPSNSAYNALAQGQQQVLVVNYQVTDERGAVNTATLTITVTGTNDAPVAVADNAAGTENQTLTINVLANDSDGDQGAVLTLVAATAPAGKGVASILGNQLVFTPGTNFDHLALGVVETVVVSYTVRDEQGAESVSTATITITGTNDAPVATADTASVLEDSALSGNLRTNDVDLDDGAVLTYTLDAPVAGLTLNADGTYSFNAANAAYQALAQGEVQNVVANYTVTDQHGATSTSTLSVAVTGTNDAPTAVADTATATEDGPVVTGSLRTNDGDVDHNAVLTYQGTNAVAGLTINGDGSYSFDASNTAYQDLAAGATRTVTGNYQVTDEFGASANSSVSVTVTGVNDAPTIVSSTVNASPRILLVDDDRGLAGTSTWQSTLTSLGYTFTTEVIASEGNPTANLANYDIVIWSNGDRAYSNLTAQNVSTLTAYLNGGGNLLYAGGHSVYDETSAQSFIQNQLGLTFYQYNMPTFSNRAAPIYATDATGAQIQLNVWAGGEYDDMFSGFQAGAATARALLELNPGNWSGDAAHNDIAVINDKGTYRAATWGFDLNHVDAAQRGAVLDATLKALSGSTGSSSGAAITERNDGAADENTVIHNATGTITYADVDVGDVHNASFTGGAGYLGAFALGTVDQAGNKLGWTFTVPDSAIDSLAAGQVLTQSYTITITDNEGASVNQVVTVTLTGTNDAPVVSGAVTATAIEDGAAVTRDALANTSDVDQGATLSVVSIGTLPAGVTYDAATHSFTLNPAHAAYQSLALGQTSVVTVTYSVTDGLVTKPTSMQWTVTGTNDAPVAVADTASVNEDATISGTVAANDTDMDAGATRTFALNAPVAGLTLNSDGSYSFSAADAAYQSLAQGATQAVVANYTVTDQHGATATSTLTITLTGTNDAPVVTSNAAAASGAVVEAGAVNAGTASATGTLTSADVDANATAAWSGSAAGVYGAFAINAAGVWTYTLDNNAAATQALSDGQIVTETFTATVSDGLGGTATQTITIQVTGAADNFAPTANAIAVSTDENAIVAGVFIGDDADADDDGATISFQLASQPAKGSVTANGANFAFNPGADFDDLAAGETRQVTFTYTSTDSHGAVSAPATVTVTVTGTNDAPVITSSALLGTAVEAGNLDDGTVVAGSSLGGTLTATDVDNGATATWSVVGSSAGTYGNLTLNASGAWTYTLDNSKAATQALAEGQSGAESFTVRVTDDKGGFVNQIVTLTVAGTNDAPVAVADIITGGNGLATALTGEILVNTQTNGQQYQSAVTALSNGNFVVSWSDGSTLGGDAASLGIKAQLFSAVGTKIGSEFLVNTQTNSTQYQSQISALANGGFVVSWSDASTVGGDNSGYGVKAQMYSAAGVKVGTEFLVNTVIASNQMESSITGLSTGGFVVTWTDSNVSSDGSGSAVKAQIYTAAGLKAGGEFQVNTLTTNVQAGSTTTALANGNFVVTWADSSLTAPDTSGTAVRAQMFTATGVKVGSEFLVNTATNSTQNQPAITALASGGFAITWSDASLTVPDTSGYAVRAAVYDAAGTKVTSDFLVNTNTLNNQITPAISAVAGGGFMISWNDQSFVGGDASGVGIKAQVFTATGVKVGSEFLVNTAITNSQDDSAITTLAGGNTVIVWTDASLQGGDASSSGIKMRLYSIASPTTENSIVTSDVLANDTDVDTGKVLTLISATAPAGHGTASVVDGKLVFTPGADFDHLAEGTNETVVISYTISDEKGATATGTATLTVIGTNDLPVVTSPASAATGAVIEAGVAANGTTPLGSSGATGTLTSSDLDDGATSTWGMVSSTNGTFGSLALTAGGVWTYTLNDTLAATQALDGGQLAVDTFTVKVTDDKGGITNQLVTINVTGSNDVPTVSGAVTLLANRLGNGGFDQTPDFSGWTTTLTSTGTTGAFTATATIDRTGSAITGDMAVAVLNYTGTTPVGYGTGYGPSIKSSAFTGAAGDVVSFTYKLTSGGDQAIGRAYIRDAVTGAIVQTVFNYQTPFTGTTGTQTVNVTLASSGNYTIDFQVGSYDATGGQAIGARLDIGFAGILANGIAEDEPFVFTTGRTSLLANASDADGDTLIIDPFTTTSTMGATVTLAANGTLTINPAGVAAIAALAKGENVTDTFTYTVSDGNGGTVVATANYTLNGANNAPVAVADFATTGKSTPVTVNVLANDTDVDHNAVLTLVSAGVTPGKGTVSVVNNQVVFNPGTAFAGLGEGQSEDVVVTYVVKDEFNITASSTLTIHVTGPAPAGLTAGGAEENMTVVSIYDDSSLAASDDGSVGVASNQSGGDSSLLLGRPTGGVLVEHEATVAVETHQATDGDDVFVFHLGTATGDHVLDFSGVASEGADKLEFVGFGEDAIFTQVDDTHWRIDYNAGAQHEVITFDNATPINVQDFTFV